MMRQLECKAKATNGRHIEVAKAGNDKRAEMLEAGKSVFCKGTRTICRLMYPKITNNQLDNYISAAWNRLSEKEKDIYISKAQEKFGIRSCTVMINPLLAQIMGMSTAVQEKCLKVSSSENTNEKTDQDADDDPDYNPSHYAKKRRNTTVLRRKRTLSSIVKTNDRTTDEETDEDADDPDYKPSRCTKKRRNTTLHRKKTARLSNVETNDGALPAASNHDVRSEKLTVHKRLCESESEGEFDDDPELKAELEKFDFIRERMYFFKDFSYGNEMITADPKDQLQIDT